MAAFAAAARADTVVLRNGARLTGTANPSIGEGRIAYRIDAEKGIALSLPGSQVTEHVRHSGELVEYQRIAPTYGDTRDEQWALAEWCRERKLERERRQHLRRVVEIDPTFNDAWLALGYIEIGGKWQTQAKYFEDKGYVFYRGRWRLPQEVDVIEERRRIELLEREWFGRLKTLRGQLGSAHEADAIAKIKTIRDPLALKAIADQLRRERSPRLRLLYIEALSGIPDRRAIELIVATALSDPNIEVFHEAADKLVELQWSGLAKSLVPSLEDANNVRVNRGAYILGKLGDRDVVPALIKALTTTHYTVRPGSGRTTATLVKDSASGSSGAVGPSFTAVERPQVTVHRIANQEVLQALVRLSGGSSFGFEQRAWMNWWSLASSR